MQSDPWESIKDSFKEGEKVKGIVTKLAPFGAFIEVAEGVEALLPSSEISDEAINIEEFLPIGKEVEATIKKFKPSERKISLTFKEYVPGQEVEEENKADGGESDDSDKPKKARKKKEDEPQAEGQTPAEATV